MKIALLAATVVLSGLTSSISHADIIRQCEDSLQDAQTNLAKVQDRFNIGEVTRTDVAAAQLELLDVRLQCGNLATEQFCGEAPAVAQTVLDGTLEEARVGQRTDAQIKAARKSVRTVAAKCN